MLEMILPEYIRQLLENYQVMYSQLTSQLRWLYFDDSFRLVTRVGYLDDGFVRLRLDGHWEFTAEVLREMSWTFYSIAEVGRNIDLLKNALESVGTDRLRVVGELSVSELNVTKVGGVAVTGRDWSQDLAKLQNLDIALSALRDVILINYANNYDLLTIDLSTARTDVLIASNVISLYVIDASSGATYSIKLFSTDRPALDQNVLPVGTGIEKLDKASVYFSNTAQLDLYVKLLVLKRV